MKKPFLKLSLAGLKWGAKGIVNTVKVATPIIIGAAQFGKEIVSDSYHVFTGTKKEQKLIEKLNLQNAEFDLKKLKFKSDYPYADACVLSGLTASEMLIRGVPDKVQEAFEMAYPGLAREQSFIESWDSLNNYEERLGFINGIKGKLFEIKYVDHLNESLEPGYVASLAMNPNQKGWDVQIMGPDQEVAQLLQLKATTSISYIKDSIEKYPEIDIVTLEDLEGQLASISSITNVSASHISNEELMVQINDGIGPHFFPTAPLLALGYIVFSSYKEKDLSTFKRHQEVGKRGSNLVLNTAIISASASPFIGIPLVLGKEFIIRQGARKKEIVRFLKKQINNNKKTQKVWKRRVSRRSFLKGLTLSSATLYRKPI
jgi:hypothetical protein